MKFTFKYPKLTEEGRTFVLTVVLPILVGIAILAGLFWWRFSTKTGEVVEGGLFQAARVRVWEDEERGVTCYIYDGDTDSLFCIPNSALEE
jgi:hypothetical protein